jgi:hypothetical protein
MTLKELLSKLTEKSIFPVRVESLPDRSDDLVFVGNLSEFIDAAKAIQSPVVFVSTVTLSEEHFYWDNSDFDNVVDERIDLRQYVPELENFNDKIGLDGHFDLCAMGPNGNLKLSIVESWMDNFAELYSQAIELHEETILDKQEQEDASENERKQHLLGNLRGLITDDDFVRLPTQRAMLAYAIDDFPELETLEESILKVEIQNLKAKIDAQGLRRK